MLNYPNREKFFENCLVETGVTDGWSTHLPLAEVQSEVGKRAALIRTLHDIRSGADALLAKGKPSEDTLGLSMPEWERKWAAWAASRKAAFYSRAALTLLGEKDHASYFINTLKNSHNIVFLSAANDVLQHATGYYLSGAEEELTNSDLAALWEKLFSETKVQIS